MLDCSRSSATSRTNAIKFNFISLLITRLYQNSRCRFVSSDEQIHAVIKLIQLTLWLRKPYNSDIRLSTCVKYCIISSLNVLCNVKSINKIKTGLVKYCDWPRDVFSLFVRSAEASAYIEFIFTRSKYGRRKSFINSNFIKNNRNVWVMIYIRKCRSNVFS